MTSYRLLLLVWCKIPLNNIGLIDRNTTDGIGRTYPCNGTLVAVQTQVMPDLKMQGTIAEGCASLHTFCTSDAELLVYDVFKIRFLNKSPFYGGGGAKLVLGTGLQFIWSRFEITPAKITIAAKVVCMDALYSGWGHDTLCCTTATLIAFKGIYLPNVFF